MQGAQTVRARAFSRLRQARMRRGLPRRASLMAVSRPMPALAPVMMITCVGRRVQQARASAAPRTNAKQKRSICVTLPVRSTYDGTLLIGNWFLLSSTRDFGPRARQLHNQDARPHA